MKLLKAVGHLATLKFECSQFPLQFVVKDTTSQAQNIARHRIPRLFPVFYRFQENQGLFQAGNYFFKIPGLFPVSRKRGNHDWSLKEFGDFHDWALYHKYL